MNKKKKRKKREKRKETKKRRKKKKNFPHINRTTAYTVAHEQDSITSHTKEASNN